MDSPAHATPDPADLAERIELRLDSAAAKGNAVPLLARLLRRLRDRDTAQADADRRGNADQAEPPSDVRIVDEVN